MKITKQTEIVSTEQYLQIIKLKRKWTTDEIKTIHYYELNRKPVKNPHGYKNDKDNGN